MIHFAFSLVFVLCVTLSNADDLIAFKGWGHCRDASNKRFRVVKNKTDSFGCMTACFADEQCVGYEVGRCNKSICNLMYNKDDNQGSVSNTSPYPGLFCYGKVSSVPTPRPTKGPLYQRFEEYEQEMNHCYNLKKKHCRKDTRCNYQNKSCVAVSVNPMVDIFKCLGKPQKECNDGCIYDRRKKVCAIFEGTCEQYVTKSGCKRADEQCKWKGKVCVEKTSK